MNIIIGAAGGGTTGATSAITKESLSWAADKMREAMIEDSKKFPGICDVQGNCLTNLSGNSAGVKGDHLKIAGGRVNLDELCENKRCTQDKSTASGYAENSSGRVILNSEDENKTPTNLPDLLANNSQWRSPMGGFQGGDGKFAFFDYAPGSVWDRLAEAYAGTHDTLNSGVFYDQQGNIKSGVGKTPAGKIGNITNYSNVILATPFALSVLLPPEAWNALVVGLKAKP